MIEGWQHLCIYDMMQVCSKGTLLAYSRFYIMYLFILM